MILILRGVVIFIIAISLFVVYEVGYDRGRKDGFSDAMKIASVLRMGDHLYQHDILNEGDIDAARKNTINGINNALMEVITYMNYSSLEHTIPKPPDSPEIEDRVIGILLAMKRRFGGKGLIRPEINNRLNDLIEDLQVRGKIEDVDLN